MSTNTTFQQYLQSAFTTGEWSTDEVIEFLLPLFEEVLGFHDANQVGSFEKPDTIFLTDGRLDIDEAFTHGPANNLSAVNKLLNFQQVKGYNITDRIIVDQDLSQAKSGILNQQVQQNINEQPVQPVYFSGYQCYELKLGHHDTQTDIFCLGLILASVIMGLDFYDIDDLNRFAAYRSQPAGLNKRIHPTLCALVTEMTELDRAQRSRDLREIVQRLKFYRDYDPQREIDLSKLAVLENKKPSHRKDFILGKLRNRLFDTSRRNRLLYYKPNTRFVNLTVSSVPMVLHYQSINPQLLFTWNSEISGQIISMKDISLNKYLRFEDHLYLNSQLNSIRLQSENDKKEYGFSQLKLVVAFLQWHNLKEDSSERIQSPLLLLPIELERKKSLKEERFTLKIIDNAAMINPVLSNYLKDLYGISLPERIDFDDISMEEFFKILQLKIDEAKQGVKLNYIDKPRIKIVHNIARQTINNYRKKLKTKGGPSFQSLDYSYSYDNYKPLGLELFRQKIEPRQAAMEFLLSDFSASGNTGNLTESNDTKVKSTFQLTDGESNPYSWDFDVCNIVLGNFNYKKMSLVGDYNKIAEGKIEHGVFNELFSNEARQPQTYEPQNNPGDWYHVISADPTQSKAVLHSRTGKSYIIQGPPGTGKSQTITNLIADFMARGKTVLFICEKRAALDVVYHRLQQNKLAELCCYIHDSQGDKKEFIHDLKINYDDFLKNRMDLDVISSQRKGVLGRLLAKVKILNDYHQLQGSINKEAGLSIRNLIENLLAIKNEIPTISKKQAELAPYYKEWVQADQIVKQLGKALEEVGAGPELANHPFSNLSSSLIKSDNPFTLLDSLIGQAHNSIQQITVLINQYNIPSEHAALIESMKSLIEDAAILEPLAKSRNLKLVDSSNPEAGEFEDAYRRFKECQHSLNEIIGRNDKWRNKFSVGDTEQAMQTALKYEKSFFGFLNSDWRNLKKQMSLAYDFSGHPVKPVISSLLNQLREEYSREDKVKRAKSELEQKYKVGDIEKVYTGVESLRAKKGDKEIDFLLLHPEANELVLKLSKLNSVFQQLELQLSQCLYGYQDKTISDLKEELATIYGNADSLKELLPYLRRFAELPASVQDFIRKVPLSPIQSEAVMANKTLQYLYNENQGFAATNQKLIVEVVSEIEKLYKQLLQLNSDLIRAEKRNKFIQNYDLSNLSPAILTPAQKLVRKDYLDGRRILEHEMGKTMRYKSIRELASNESGKVLKDIKPVWLMSPLSVSDSLPLDSGYFDVVIFDEASQITLEEGIPALFRAPQAIIVGDDKQMPPSSFFNARTEDPQDLETVEGEIEDEILSTEADSLLVQGSRKLQSTMLSWHYRSRYETLISYSNHAFYKAALLTIPDKTIHHYSKPLLEVQQADDAERNTPFLLNDSISFHYLLNSIYEARSNIQEAKYIAGLVRRLLMDGVQETIGIVAFSQEQQGAIEEAIDELALLDKKFEEVLEKAYNRKDDNQFTGLFVKNLENVQGDERDIIIISVCYGQDANKKMLMNFGPINKKGGERRLNVIFSRARKHMAVISSIRHSNITNDYNPGANYFKRFLQYAEMVSTGNMSAARVILDNLINTGEQKEFVSKSLPASIIEIKRELESKGYIVDQQIGQSSFKCSLGIKRTPGDASYCLGILVDDELYYQNKDVVEQYFQRPSILQQFGWQIETVFVKDWLENKERVVESLIRRIGGSNEVVRDKVDSASNSQLAAKPYNPNLIVLKSKDGERFWEIEQAGKQLNIRFGKSGTRGQVQVKMFEREEEAVVMKEQLVEEQMKSGFENGS